jgi:ketosteroid isomerase-like protein
LILRSVVVAVIALAGACTSETVPRPTNPYVDRASLDAPPAADAGGAVKATAKERALTRIYLEALRMPSFADLGRLLHDHVHFAFAGFHDVHGRDNVLRVHGVLLGGLEGRSFVARRVLVTDDSQIVEWTMTATHKETKRPVALKGVTLLWTTDDGSIRDYHLYFDEALLAAQIGTGPKQLQSLPPPQVASGEPETVEQTHLPEEAANVAVVRASLEALENRDETAYAAAMIDDVEITTLEAPKPARGRAEARAYFKAIHKSIAQLDTSTDNAWGIGPYVVIEYHIVGEQRGSIGWVPIQKDNLLKMFVVDVAELQGGKIARLWRYENPTQILATPVKEALP